MAPVEDLLDQGKSDELFPEQQGENLKSEDFLDNSVMKMADTMNSIIRGSSSFCNQYMDMGMKIDAVSESLDKNRSKGWYSFNWENCMNCSRRDECDSNCDLLKNIPEDISEFIFEPGSASGFVRFPPKSLIKNMVNFVRKNKGNIIVNEVTSGIGRTRKWFGYQHYGIVPDMVSIGKGIGNGYPVSVAVLSSDIVKDLSKKSFLYSQSHQNDPLGASIAYEVIKVIEEDDLITNVEKKGEKFFLQLNGLVDGEIVLGARGNGLMFAIDLAIKEIGDEIYNELIRKGYVVCNRGSLFRIDPPLIISEDEFNEFVDAFTAILKSQKNSK